VQSHEGFELRRGGPADVPAIASLRETVGWGVHDWALRAVTELADAVCIVAVDGAARRPVGTGSGIAYGPLGVVGNMVVDPGHRRRGIGAAILDAVVGFLHGLGCRRLELSATALGRPLYARRGFTPVDGGGLSALVPRQPAALEPSDDVVEAGPSIRDELSRFDAARFGGDRGPLLDLMLSDPARPVLVARVGAHLVGWGCIRPEAGRIGPLVADAPAHAVALLSEGLRRMPEAPSVRLNLPAPSSAARRQLAALGAAFEAWDGRMALGPPIPRRDETIYASAVGALG
jgi:GNAT superfamily N-acetyltransferase